MAADASALISPQAIRATLRWTLGRLRAQARLVLAVRLATIGVLVGAATLTVLVGIERLHGVTHALRETLMPLAVACLASILAAAIWPLPDRRLAAGADRRLHLWDRLATASELARAGDPSGMERAQIADAVRHCAQVRPAAAYRLRRDRLTSAALGCVAALLIVQLAPIPPLLLSAGERAEQAQLRQVARQIQPVAAQLHVQADEADDEETREVAKRMERLAGRMERGELGKREALLELSELQKRLAQIEERAKAPTLRTARTAAEELSREGRESLAQQAEALAETARERNEPQIERRLREAAEQAREAESTEELRAAAREIAEAAAALGEDAPAPAQLGLAAAEMAAEEMERALSDLRELQEALASGALSATEATELAERMQRAAQAVQGTELDDLGQALAQAAEQLREGDQAEAAAALGQAVEAMGEGMEAGQLAEAAGGARAAAGQAAEELRASAQAAAAAAAGRAPGASGTGRAGGLGVGPDQGTRQGIPPGTEGASLYAPRQTPVAATPEGTRAAVRPEGEMYTAPTRGAPDQTGPSRVPYYEVVGEYSRAAEEALEREEIPAAYRGTVREYFEALQGGRPGGAAQERSDD